MIERFFKSRQWKVFLVTFCIGAPIFMLSMFEEVFLLITMACVFTMVLKPVVDYLEIKGFPRSIAILGVYVVLGSLVALSLITIYPIIVDQVVTLSSQLDSNHLPKMVNEMGRSISMIFPFFKAEDVAAKLTVLLGNLTDQAGGLLTSVIGLVASLIIVPLLGFFLLKDYYAFQKLIIENVPNKYFEMALNVMYKIENQLSKHIRGVFLETVLVAILYTIAFEIVGLDRSIVLGLISGVLNIIPLAGPIIGAIPAIIVSIMQTGDLSLLIPIVVGVLVVQQLDEILIQPNVYGKMLNIHPLTIILVILIGNEILGVLGMILAIPIYTIIAVTARETNWGLANYRITH